MVEVWKDIDVYEGLYQVSNLGNVKSLNYNHTSKERILKPGANTKGYLKVTLCKDRKVNDYSIQQLVADAFIPNPNGYSCVNHKDENKLNNCVDNLEWCSHKYNANYGTRNKRIAEKLSIPVYCLELDKIFTSAKEACRITGVHQGNITLCLKGKRNTAGGYHWAYSK